LGPEIAGALAGGNDRLENLRSGNDSSIAATASTGPIADRRVVMLGADASIQAVPLAGAAAVRPSQPQPETRVVESTSRASLQQQHARSTLARLPSALEELAASARQFAEVLDSTGNVQVASSVSGFRVGHLDTYA
jgi:hypothetical protein